MTELSYVVEILLIHTKPTVVWYARRALVACPPIRRYVSGSATVNSSGRLVRREDPVMGSPENCWLPLTKSQMQNKKQRTYLYNYPVPKDVV